jgi:hypothetical protein
VNDAATAVATPPATPPAPPPSGNPYTARLGVIADAHYDTLPPDEQTKFARVRKGPDGGSEWLERSRLPSETAAANGTKQPDGSPGPAVNPGEASITVDGKFEVGDLELSAEDIAGLMERRALEETRRTQVPVDGAYRPELPAEIKLPGDVKFEVRADDAAFKDLAAWSAKAGLGQDQFSEVLGIYAADRARELDALRTASARNLAALGANAQSRLTAVDTWIRGVVGDSLGKEMRGMLVTSRIIEGFEKIMTRHSTQGHASFTQHGRTPQDAQPGRVSEAEYDGMSPAQRYAYSKSFDQKQFRS